MLGIPSAPWRSITLILCELSLACLLPPCFRFGFPLHFIITHKRTGSSVSKWPWKVQIKGLLNSIIWNAEILYEMLPSIAMATWCHLVTEQTSQHLAETVLLPLWAKGDFESEGPAKRRNIRNLNIFTHLLGERNSFHFLSLNTGQGPNHTDRRCTLSRRKSEQRIKRYHLVHALKACEKGDSWGPNSAEHASPGHGWGSSCSGAHLSRCTQQMIFYYI